eukprot:6555001-Ditylum_brightwellii.AAC.1
MAQNAHDGDAPKNVNHHKAANHYQSLYGEEWEKKIVETVHMRKFARNTEKISFLITMLSLSHDCSRDHDVDASKSDSTTLDPA